MYFINENETDLFTIKTILLHKKVLRKESYYVAFFEKKREILPCVVSKEKFGTLFYMTKVFLVSFSCCNSEDLVRLTTPAEDFSLWWE